MKRASFVILLLFFASFAYAQNVSVDDAQLALEESSQIINELYSAGFSTTSASDSYSSAMLVFQQATYADVLRNNSIPDSDSIKIQAKKALEFVNWRNVTYLDVIYYTDLIKQYKTDSYYILDSLISLDKQIKTYQSRGVNMSSSENLLRLTNESLYQGRIKEGLSYVEQTTAQIEKDVEAASSVRVLAENAKNFFLRYIYWIIGLVVLLIIGIYFGVKYAKTRALKKQILKLETEEKVLDKLMKKTQTERYKENKISGLIYNIRMSKYQERLSEIKRDLPVLKKRLSKR